MTETTNNTINLADSEQMNSNTNEVVANINANNENTETEISPNLNSIEVPPAETQIPINTETSNFADPALATTDVQTDPAVDGENVKPADQEITDPEKKDEEPVPEEPKEPEEPKVVYICKYKLEEFVGSSKEILQDYVCPLCKGVYDNPIVDSCNDIFCKVCLDQYMALNDNMCPVKNIKITNLFPINLIQQLIEKQNMVCKNAEKECKWTGLVKDLYPHIETECAKQEVPCKFKACDKKMPREEAEAHQDTCDFKEENCQFCEEVIVLSMKAKHLADDCPKAEIKCAFCTISILRDEMQNHLATTCQMFEIECPFTKLGCVIKCLRKDVVQHMQMGNNTHMLNLGMKFVDFDQKLNHIAGMMSDKNTKNNKLYTSKFSREKLNTANLEVEYLSTGFRLKNRLTLEKVPKEDERLYYIEDQENLTLGLNDNPNPYKYEPDDILLLNSHSVPYKSDEIKSHLKQKRNKDPYFIEEDSAVEDSKTKKSNSIAICKESSSPEIKILSESVATFFGNTPKKHLGILTDFKLNNPSIKKPIKYNCKIISSQNWIAVGAIIKEVFVQNTKNFTLFNKNKVASGVYLLSNNGYLWNSKDTAQNNVHYGFYFTSNSVITCTYDNKNKTIDFEFTSQKNDKPHCHMRLNNILCEANQTLVPAAFIIASNEIVEFELLKK